MELAKAVLTSFILIDADWLAERARSLIERLDPSHVIIRRTGLPEDHFLLTRDRVMSQLAAAVDSMPVGQVLQLSRLTPTPVAEADMESSAALAVCIVRREGLIIGFCDAVIPSSGGPPTEVITRLRTT